MATRRLSEEDRKRFARQVDALAGAETDDEGTPGWRRRVVQRLNELRARSGTPPLQEWWEGKGEIELYERARALGLQQRVRTSGPAEASILSQFAGRWVAQDGD